MDLDKAIAALEDVERRYHDLVDPQASQVTALVGVAKALAQQVSAANAAVDALAARIAAIEAHPAVSIPPLEPKAAAPEGGDKPADTSAAPAPAAEVKS